MQNHPVPPTPAGGTRMEVSTLTLLPAGPTPQLQQVVWGCVQVSRGSPWEWRPPLLDHISDPAQDFIQLVVVSLVLGGTTNCTVCPDVASLEGAIPSLDVLDALTPGWLAFIAVTPGQLGLQTPLSYKALCGKLHPPAHPSLPDTWGWSVLVQDFCWSPSEDTTHHLACCLWEVPWWIDPSAAPFFIQDVHHGSWILRKMKHLGWCSLTSPYQISKQAQQSMQFHIQAGDWCDFVFACPAPARRSIGHPFSSRMRDVTANSTISQTVVFLFGMK